MIETLLEALPALLVAIEAMRSAGCERGRPLRSKMPDRTTLPMKG